MAISRLKTSRSRLLAILMSIMMPIAVIMSAAAWTNYKFTSAGIERDYNLLTANYASRMRIWLRESERSLIAVVAGIGAREQVAGVCGAAAEKVIGSIRGYRGLYIRFPGGVGCRAAKPGFPFEDTQVNSLLQTSANGIAYEPADDGKVATRLYFPPEQSQGIVLQSVFSGEAPGQEIVAMLVIDPAVLDHIMAFGDVYPHSTIAAVLGDGRVVAAQGAEATSGNWKPANIVLGDELRHWFSRGPDGVERIYASRPIAVGGLYIIGGFSTNDLIRAWRQFLLLIALPLMVILALTLAFLKAVDTYVIDWLKQLEWAARERSALREAKVAISPRMPSEVRSLARAFQEMADAESARRTALEKALDENRFLVRELHHRVKNSLQVIQSYLSLTRRGQSGPAREAVVDAELRVQVLSLAYRISLADGIIRDINLSEFLGQMIHTAACSIFSRGQTVTLSPPATTISLELEKAIALGFLLADLFTRAAQGSPQFALSLALAATADEAVLTITSDRPIALGAEPRINRGLQIQLDARAIAPDPGAGIVGGWRWATSDEKGAGGKSLSGR